MPIDRFLIVVALVFLITGMVFGGWMGAREDFTFAPAHAHWNLLGFVSSAVYALIYRAYPAVAASRLAWPQAVAHVVGTAIFAWGLIEVASSGTFSPMLMAGPSLVVLAAFVFLIIFVTRGHKSA